MNDALWFKRFDEWASAEIGQLQAIMEAMQVTNISITKQQMETDMVQYARVYVSKNETAERWKRIGEKLFFYINSLLQIGIYFYKFIMFKIKI